MRPSEYAINLTAVLFLLTNEEIDRTISNSMITIYKHYDMLAEENIEVTSNILLGIIHRKIEEREYSGPFYILLIKDPKNFHNLLIWLKMRGKIGPCKLMVIRF
ncbi:MAG: hypothetical protein ACPL3Q_09770 [Candidatus Ratteibacteria bacterium]